MLLLVCHTIFSLRRFFFFAIFFLFNLFIYLFLLFLLLFFLSLPCNTCIIVHIYTVVWTLSGVCMINIFYGNNFPFQSEYFRCKSKYYYFINRWDSNYFHMEIQTCMRHTYYITLQYHTNPIVMSTFTSTIPKRNCHSLLTGQWHLDVSNNKNAFLYLDVWLSFLLFSS